MRMRWDDLFEDLEAQLAAATAADLASEITDRTRREVAALTLLQRARSAVGTPVRVQARGVEPVAGMLLQVGSQWLLLRDAAGREVLVVWDNVIAVTGLGIGAEAAEPGVVFQRLGLASALRGVARDRATVTLGLVDGSVVTGTLDRVGQDFVEVGEHAAGEPRRPGQVRAVRTVAFSGVASVTRLP
jgi:hypothetical protein